MHYAGVDVQSFKTLSYQTIYFVLISLLFFPIFAQMLPYHGFWWSAMAGVSVSGTLMLLLAKFIS